MSLSAIDFGTYFSELNGYEPFPWQSRFADQIISGNWPAGISVPTAAGKTACIDISIFALALSTDGNSGRVPRRIMWVVDRRCIVDEAFDRASTIADRLRTADGGVLKEVADRLRELAGEANPLHCARLRGGVYRDQAWCRTPTQPTVICSTVDQIGSRLLFRGYGVGRNSRALHAGLVGNDALVVLDEAHVSEPMRQTLAAVSEFRSKETCFAPFRFLVVSATPPSDVQPVLECNAEDRRHPVLSQRIKASKPTKLVSASNLVDELVKQATSMRKGGVSRIAVMVNRVDTAKQVYSKLLKKGQAILLTGRMRDVDRDEVLGEWLPRLRAGSEDTTDVYVVATQTLEVGANLDFDGLVTECAALDALRQRFGRLNRLGLSNKSPGAIVIPKTNIKSKKPDFIYGEALAATWKWLTQNAKDGTIDMGIRRVENLLAKDDSGKLTTPREDAPILLPAHLNLLVQTSPQPAIEPDLSLWLHGMGRRTPKIQVAWRVDLETNNSGNWIDILAAIPPASSELLEVSIFAFQRWLKGDANVDTEDVNAREDAPRDSRSDEPCPQFVIWSGPEESVVTQDGGDLRPGDVVILPESAGGWDDLGCIISDDAGHVDRAEVAQLLSRRQPMLRLSPDLVKSWECNHALLEWIAEADADHDTCRDAISKAVPPESLGEVTLAMLASPTLTVVEYPSGFIVSGERIEDPRSDTFTSEDDTASATGFVSLVDHLQSVGQRAKGFAARSGLSSDLVDDIERAGLLHDVGKADPRFQALLQGGVRMTDTLLAKSGRLPTFNAMRAARRQSGYPRGGRHELLSVRLAESSQELIDGCHDPDLVLHLIGSHHGRCRPFAPVVPDREPTKVAYRWNGESLSASSETHLESVDSGVAERFWSLVDKYGWWGLAYLESMLVLADRRQSESEMVLK